MPKQFQLIPKLTSKQRDIVKMVCQHLGVSPRTFATQAVLATTNNVIDQIKQEKIKRQEARDEALPKTDGESPEGSEPNTEVQK